jgi:hypothetical protein
MIEIERRKLENDDARLKLDRSFARKWAPTLGAVLIPVTIGLATLALTNQQISQAAQDNRIKQGSLCLDYFHKFDTDPSYTGLDPKQRTATLETLRAIFTDFPECLALHVEAIQNAYLAAAAGGGGNGTDRLFELNKILAQIGTQGYAVRVTAPADAPVAVQAAEPAGSRAAYQVYMHFRNDADRTRIQQIADALAVKGWHMKPIQHVVQPTNGDVRYYKSGEAQDADMLAKDVAGIVSGMPGLPAVDLKPIFIGKTYPDLPAGVMEVWISDL